MDILDRDDRLHRVDYAEVRNRRHIDADVVPGDDALGLDRHRDDPQRHSMQHIDERDNDPQPGYPHAVDWIPGVETAPIPRSGSYQDGCHGVTDND